MFIYFITVRPASDRYKLNFHFTFFLFTYQKLEKQLCAKN